MKNKKQFNNVMTKVNGIKLPRKFAKMSDYIVEKNIVERSAVPLEKEAKIILTSSLGYGMMIGREMVKSKYLVTGAMIGIAGTIGYFKLKEMVEKEEA